MLTLRALVLLAVSACVVTRAFDPDLENVTRRRVENEKFRIKMNYLQTNEVPGNEIRESPRTAKNLFQQEEKPRKELLNEIQADSINQSLQVQELVRTVKWLEKYSNQTRQNYTEEPKNEFAHTPHEEAFFDPTKAPTPAEESEETRKKDKNWSVMSSTEVSKLPRETRQHLNKDLTRALHSGELDKLKIGFANEDLTANSYHLENGFPVSSNTFYAVILIASITTTVFVALLGFVFAYLSFSRRAKAAADVEYPAYGVTGPTADAATENTARSAHIFHYQHQKQLITGMDKNGLERCASYATDPESDDENEEGQYTVYECPGFATTADIEIKNPLFNQESAPSTPGKRDVMKSQ